MATIYSQGKTELSPPSKIQAVGYSPIMDSDLNEHVFKCIDLAMVITHAGRSPLAGELFGVPQKCVNIDHVPGKKDFTQTNLGASLPPSLVRFPSTGAIPSQIPSHTP